MGDVAVRGSVPSPSPGTVDTPEEAVETKVASGTQATPQQSGQSQSSETSAKKGVVNKEYAAQKKGEQALAGTVTQRELNQKLLASKTRTTEFPVGADNKQLSQINVNRYVSRDGATTTRYPNGVKVKTFESSLVSEHPLKPGKYEGGMKHESGGVGIEVTAPPGGSIKVEPDGRMIISDRKGKEVGTMDNSGKFHVHTGQGDYTQSRDGKIGFATAEKKNPGDLHKSGAIDPADYEKYGIVSNGGTLEFPNGVKYTPRSNTVDPSIYKGNEKLHGDQTMEVSQETGGVVQHLGHSKEETVYARTGEPLYDRSGSHVSVHGGDGTYEIGPGGKVTFVKD